VTLGSDDASGRPARHVPDLGDLVLLFLAGSLAGLRDRLSADGYDSAAEVVADLVDIADDHLTRISRPRLCD
jgi:hypothetical protein